jgi:hypothetical protein
MSLYVDPPFSLGQTLGVSSTSDGTGWVGTVKVFPDVNPTTGVIRSNRVKKCVAVRNTSAGALLAKRVVRFAVGTAGTAVFSAVDGYSAVGNNEVVGVVDEFLPSAGVAVNDVFWVTVDGPTEVAVALSGTAVAVGDRLAAITAATSGATTAGRVTPSALTASTTSAGNDSLGVIGYACSVGATTGTAVLALVRTNVA